MQISQESAQQIVEEIGRLVHQHINMMDETGHIIASTDASRIGQFHEGAHSVITRQLPELYVTAQTATPTTRRGLNLPIEAEGAIVGVIGLTGDYDKVIHYGQIVKKMTEILIRERTQLDEQRLDLRVRSRFLENWILGEGLTHAAALAERGLALGIDITLPRRVMVVSVQELERYTDSVEGQQLLETVENAVSASVETHSSNIILRNAARQILLVDHRSTEKMHVLALDLAQKAQSSYGVRLAIGIDGTAPDLHTAYLEANRAWRSAHRREDGIIGYDEISIELFLDDIPRKRKSEYLRKIFKNCNAAELRMWIGLLEAYFAADGSLTLAASALFIHKNTLQYRLKRLAELTGLDVRLPRTAAALYMAMLFFRDVENELAYLEI